MTEIDASNNEVPQPILASTGPAPRPAVIAPVVNAPESPCPSGERLQHHGLDQLKEMITP
jgi:hypothetical protein